MKYWLLTRLQLLVDVGIALWPRPAPPAERWRDCRLISHRGEHDNRRVFENTMAAFERAVAAGAWGIEFDLQWTRDLHPVVIHDPDTRRVFGEPLEIGAVELAELRRRVPQVPTLEEVIAAFGGDTHLMVELKGERGHRDADKARRLRDLFADLRPVHDYHLLALDPVLLDAAHFAGAAAQVLVAELNARRMSEEVMRRGLGGICGHYLLMTAERVERHQALGQSVGIGFASSRYGLYREVARGVDWIFTNHAERLGRARGGLEVDRR